MARHTKFLKFVILLVAITFSACDKSTEDAAPHPSDILIVDSNTGFPDDDFRIITIRVDRNILIAEVEYGGGCGDVEFKLLGNSSFMESNPVQSELSISFRDEDPCEALVRKEVLFNIRPLADVYKAAYHVKTGTILLRIDNYAPLVEYSF